MTNVIVERITQTSHPRLTVLLVTGLVLLAIGGITTVLDPIVGPDLGLLSFRVGVLGYLLLLFGGSGYIALTLSKRLSQ